MSRADKVASALVASMASATRKCVATRRGVRHRLMSLWRTKMKTLLVALLLAASAAPAMATEVPSQFHGLWCDGGYIDQGELYTRAQSNCPNPNPHDMAIDADGLKGSNANCRITKVTVKKGWHAMTFFCNDQFGYDREFRIVGDQLEARYPDWLLKDMRKDRGMD
jgi:hypothetical protein